MLRAECNVYIFLGFGMNNPRNYSFGHSLSSGRIQLSNRKRSNNFAGPL
jgi:hypothetical protein